MRSEVAQALLKEAVAYAGLRPAQYEKALASLNEARQLFVEEGSQFWVTTTDLEKAYLLHRQQKWQQRAFLFSDRTICCLQAFVGLSAISIVAIFKA